MTLEPTARFGTVEVTLAQNLKATGMPESVLLEPVASFACRMEVGVRAWQHATIFRVKSGDDYNLHLFTKKEGSVCLWRNGLQLEVGLNGSGVAVVFAIWTPTTLLLEIRAGGQTMTAGPLFTPPAGLPSLLPGWLRERALLQKQAYKDGAEVLDELVMQLEHLAEKIRKTGGVEGFWDDQYRGKKRIGSIPKQETKLTRTVAFWLQDLAFQKNIQVNPEALAGPGRMDFLFTAPLHDGTTVRVCGEFKNVHSASLLSGIETQLPIYMNNKDTLYGLFCALDFGGKYKMRARPQLHYKRRIRAPGPVLAEYAARRNPLMHIRSVVIPMHKGTSPSKR